MMLIGGWRVGSDRHSPLGSSDVALAIALAVGMKRRRTLTPDGKPKPSSASLGDRYREQRQMIAVIRNDLFFGDESSRSGLWINKQKVHARSRSKKISMHHRSARRSFNSGSVAN